MNLRIAGFALLVLVSVVPAAPIGAQGTQDPWYGRQAKPKNFDSAKIFTGAFSIELPKNWQIVPGHTGTIFSTVEKTSKGETAGFITLEYQSLQEPLEPADMPGASQRELRELRARELSGKAFAGSVKTGTFGSLILIQYDRPGLSSGDDHVAQYSIPVGTTMYRLICIAPAAEVEKYRPIFAHVAASFAPQTKRS